MATSRSNSVSEAVPLVSRSPIPPGWSSIRPDSPHVKQACSQLGILPESLRIKTIDQFTADKTIPEDIKNLRYNHYLNRVGSMIREVMATRRQLRRNENALLARQQTGGAITEPATSPMGRWGTAAASTSRVHDKKSAERSVPPEYQEDYQRTIGYIRSSLRSPALRQPIELNITGTDLNTSHGVETSSMGATRFADEVKRFNRMRLLVQNNGQHYLEMEKKRYEVMNQQAAKEERLQATLRKRDKQREKARRALKYEEEERLERVKEKIKEEEAARRKKIRDMMEEDKRKVEVVRQERHRHHSSMMESLDRLRMSHRRVMGRAEVLSDQRERFYDRALQKLETRLEDHTRRSGEFIDDRIRRARTTSEKAFNTFARQKEESVVRQEETFIRLATKMERRESAFHSWMRQMNAAEAKRRREKEEQEERLMEAKKELRMLDRQKKREIEAKFDHADTNVKSVRMEGERRIRLKKELRELKKNDLLDNYEREKRRNGLKHAWQIEKEVRAEERLQIMKSQSELIHKTRKEAALFVKLERDRVMNGVSMLTDEIFPLHEKSIKKDAGIPVDKAINSIRLIDSIVSEPSMKIPVKSLRNDLDSIVKKKKNSETIGFPQ